MQKITYYLTVLILTILVLIYLKPINDVNVNNVVAKNVSFSENEEKVFFDSIPTIKGIKSSDEDLSKISWNRWTVDKFSIHSIDKNIGTYLYKNIKDIKKEVLVKWGLPNIEFNHEIRIFCCSSEENLQKLFNINKSSFEFKEDKKIIFVWLILNESNLNSFKSLMMSISLIELEFKYNYSFPLWIHRGMPSLCDINKTKEHLQYMYDLNKTGRIKNLIILEQSEYDDLEDNSKKLFDISSSLLCLMIRKEFGQDNFQKCMLKNVKIYQQLGFKDLDSFSLKYRYYCHYLLDDYKKNILPEEYLNIKPKK